MNTSHYIQLESTLKSIVCTFNCNITFFQLIGFYLQISSLKKKLKVSSDQSALIGDGLSRTFVKAMAVLIGRLLVISLLFLLLSSPSVYLMPGSLSLFCDERLVCKK